MMTKPNDDQVQWWPSPTMTKSNDDQVQWWTSPKMFLRKKSRNHIKIKNDSSVSIHSCNTFANKHLSPLFCCIIILYTFVCLLSFVFSFIIFVCSLFTLCHFYSLFLCLFGHIETFFYRVFANFSFFAKFYISTPY